ncbi:aldehyde dehydrogenase family protein [Celeribacter indicus]|uniref:Aldehyde dehydrogenase n=1 Tax=Celeribacter indicus TaxID=1208324 RepID=A0A0B5E205_9RHOB|nr:aldehyde dehydrogenase family protein [Celeribacter indicus]AJE47081.1 aldehyde dehydrogenase [Celeribacter indicus]SDW91423.1 coniferyl-aldehyde dehydrogenase [Celeribacter indicus]
MRPAGRCIADDGPVGQQSRDRSELAAILERQRKSFLSEGPPDARQRKEKLRRLRSAVLAHRLELADAISADFGNRSRYETEIMEVVPVIQAIDYHRRKLRRFMTPERRHVALPYRAGHAHIEYQPKGVIGIMAPWNYPFSLVMVPLVTALAAGNRAMIKPSELTPRTGEVIRRMLADVFGPEEVAVVVGGPEIGAAFSALAFDHLLFTGSTQVGRKVMRRSPSSTRPRPLALYYFGERDGDCATLLTRTTSGNVGINNTLMHVAIDDLPFGGIGPSGMGAYHGVEGFRSMSHAKGVFIQGRWTLSGLLRAPFGKMADLALAVTLGRSVR